MDGKDYVNLTLVIQDQFRFYLLCFVSSMPLTFMIYSLSILNDTWMLNSVYLDIFDYVRWISPLSPRYTLTGWNVSAIWVNRSRMVSGNSLRSQNPVPCPFRVNQKSCPARTISYPVSCVAWFSRDSAMSKNDSQSLRIRIMACSDSSASPSMSVSIPVSVK